jgi:hypothetical protein
MCYGKHKVLPILWMVRDSFKFYSPNVHKSPKPKKSENILISSYRGHQHALNEIKLFLNSKESLLFKSKLAAEISELIGGVKESDKIFNAAFKSCTNWLIKDRNKCIIKIIVKSLTPAWIVNNYRERKSNQHMGGVDTTSPSKDALNKIRFSVLAFAKIYNNSNKHKIKT